ARAAAEVAGGRAGSAYGSFDENRVMGVTQLVFACAACRAPSQANPNLVMSIPASWSGNRFVADSNGDREPVCESCARQLLARFEREHLAIPAVAKEPDYFERAYHQGADEQEL